MSFEDSCFDEGLWVLGYVGVPGLNRWQDVARSGWRSSAADVRNSMLLASCTNKASTGWWLGDHLGALDRFKDPGRPRIRAESLS